MPSPLDITITVDAEGLEGLQRLGELGRHFAESSIMEALGDDVARWSRDRITSRKNTAPDQSIWASLHPATRKRKAAKGFGHQGTLMQTGSLWSSIVSQPGAEENSVQVGSRMPYAAIHQYGGKAGRGHKVTIPARPYLGLSEKQKELLRQKVELWLRKLIEGK